MKNQFFAGVEAGGTKFVCAVGTSKQIMSSVVIPTTKPDETMPQVLEFFEKQRIKLGDLLGLGIGSFGPIDLNPGSSRFGYIGKTPKRHWSNFDLITTFKSLNCPIRIDTDVNAAGLAEANFGYGRNKRVVLYITVGTGIGVGVIIDKKPFHGRFHSEIGHIIVPKDPVDCDFKGVCPYHESCIEGLASGPAIEKRWGQSLSHLPIAHPAQHLQARYISMLCVNLILSFSPDVILVGGGVMKAPGILDKIHENVLKLLRGYVPSLETLDDFKNLIKNPELEDWAGIRGSLLLAEQELPN
ncbi:ROK family protein [Pseudomonadales bacterium]|nr:ROK family protein [Pseudomonadales bacterium]